MRIHPQDATQNMGINMKRLWPAALCFAWVSQSPVVAEEHMLRLVVLDAATSQPMAARLKLTDQNGRPHFFNSDEAEGAAVIYNKASSVSAASTEAHTTVSSHRVRVSLPDGEYQLTTSRGKSYAPVTQTVQVSGGDQNLTIRLSRWSDPNIRGWYSGDTHLHRATDELRTVVLAEDINVAMPLNYWVVNADVLPMQSDRGSSDVTEGLMRVDERHVIWPSNTEYEIFDIGEKQHILGALFVLGHREPLGVAVPPWRPVIQSARQSDPKVLFDMDKLDWYDAMVLPPLAPDSLYELANNHVWETEFAYRNWYTFAPAYIHPPYGSTSGGHREWIDYTLGMYYTLLNCGFRLPPSAGTANGVHPVPAGFSRVYVQLDEEFHGDVPSFERWREGLQAGRSFVTTGPMLYAKSNGHHPGHVFKVSGEADPSGKAEPQRVEIDVEVLSLHKLAYGELLFNGSPIELLRARNEAVDSGGFRTRITTSVDLDRSGWFAVRFWEPREDGQNRFAHTAPWYVECEGDAVTPTDAQKQYLLARMRHSISRSQGVVSDDAFSEYTHALSFYDALDTTDDSEEVVAQSRPLTPQNREAWLSNMIDDHRYTRDEIRLATGLSIDEAQAEIVRYQPERKIQLSESPASETPTSESLASAELVRMLPYPGGRHPRRGFLEGAIRPQRDTKVSLFAPWSDGGYVVVDLPEAIFTDLGLTYLAHTHIPTIWDEQNIKLEPTEWRGDGDRLVMSRRLPNGIKFESRIERFDDGAEMSITIQNGTQEMLKNMRAQVCTMLKGVVDFNAQQNLERVVDGPMVAVRGASRAHPHRWIITGWMPNHRAWTNPPVPCVHSDPVFADCPPGKTVEARGGIWFYEGTDINRQIAERVARLSD